MKRKITAVILLLVLICTLTACKSSKKAEESAKTAVSDQTIQKDKKTDSKEDSAEASSESETHRHQWVYKHNYETVNKKVGTTLIVDQNAAEIPVKKKQYICNEDGYSFDTEEEFNEHSKQTGCDQGFHVEDVVVDVKQQEEVTHYEDITEKVTQDNGYWVCSVCGQKK